MSKLKNSWSALGLCLLIGAGCASSGDDGTGAAGTSGVAGTSGSAGSSGAGGASASGGSSGGS
ncbi:MAG TPA: hypothetical protein VIK30_12760, partial [Polyangia bacterium]